MTDRLLDVGHVGRPHGLQGELAVTLTTDVEARVAPGSVLHTDRGPLVVRTSRPHKGRFLVCFENITDRDEAERWRGLILRAERLEDDPTDDVLWVHELVGCTVRDADGVERGTVVSVVANPASDLLELDSGALVPLRFVTEMVPNQLVRVETPVGLFEINDPEAPGG